MSNFTSSSSIKLAPSGNISSATNVGFILINFCEIAYAFALFCVRLVKGNTTNDYLNAVILHISWYIFGAKIDCCCLHLYLLLDENNFMTQSVKLFEFFPAATMIWIRAKNMSIFVLNVFKF